jgi:hypothetical protein
MTGTSVRPFTPDAWKCQAKKTRQRVSAGRCAAFASHALSTLVSGWSATPSSMRTSRTSCWALGGRPASSTPLRGGAYPLIRALTRVFLGGGGGWVVQPGVTVRAVHQSVDPGLPVVPQVALHAVADLPRQLLINVVVTQEARAGAAFVAWPICGGLRRVGQERVARGHLHVSCVRAKATHMRV